MLPVCTEIMHKASHKSNPSIRGQLRSTSAKKKAKSRVKKDTAKSRLTKAHPKSSMFSNKGGKS